MVNQTLFETGYHTTITDLFQMSGGGGQSTILSTFVYGPYGGGLTGSLYYEREVAR
jgi:hypothetical protein